MGCEPVYSKKGSNKGVDFWIRLRIKVQRLFHVSRQPNVNRPEHLDIPHTHTKRAHVFISLFIIKRIRHRYRHTAFVHLQSKLESVHIASYIECIAARSEWIFFSSVCAGLSFVQRI